MCDCVFLFHKPLIHYPTLIPKKSYIYIYTQGVLEISNDYFPETTRHLSLRHQCSYTVLKMKMNSKQYSFYSVQYCYQYRQCRHDIVLLYWRNIVEMCSGQYRGNLYQILTQNCTAFSTNIGTIFMANIGPILCTILHQYWPNIACQQGITLMFTRICTVMNMHKRVMFFLIFCFHLNGLQRKMNEKETKLLLRQRFKIGYTLWSKIME